MKSILVLFALISAPSAFASAPSPDLAQITRALINSPDIVTQLKSNGSDHLADVQISTMSPGVNQYKLIFNRQCECLPSTATVSITEDLTPTYRDGAAVYTSSIKIDAGH